MEEKELLVEIEVLRNNLYKLISDDAGFEEIYSLSRKLDRNIARLYRIKADRSIV